MVRGHLNLFSPALSISNPNFYRRPRNQMTSHANPTLLTSDIEGKIGMDNPESTPSDDRVRLPRTMSTSASNLDEKSTSRRVTEPATNTVGEDNGNLVSFWMYLRTAPLIDLWLLRCSMQNLTSCR